MTAPAIPRADFLFELGTEELPPKALAGLERALAEGFAQRLAEAGLAHGRIDSCATPRRLALRVRRLALAQPEQKVRRRGPPLRAAFDAAGAPTRAAEAFAASCGVAIGALGRERDEKQNEYLHYSGTKPGAAAAELLPGIAAAALEALPTPKRMRWGKGDTQFVRPVHWLVMLHGAEVVPARILGLDAGRCTRGHRFHAPGDIALRSPAGYERALATRGHVIASFTARRERVRTLVVEAARAAGGEALLDDALLDEVTALVEWPVAVTGGFDAGYLSLPREVLIATLKDHQRYFPVASASGELLPAFITLSNIESRDPAVVRAGNERVVRPRLADASFFWEQDRRAPLASRAADLARVTYQAQLGSLAGRSERIAAIAARLAGSCGADAARVERAALLAKCDLLSAMVGEFPELQGTMGRYYALADGEDAEVAAAIGEHYLPRGAGDALPATPTGTALALADRLDTLAGVFATGQKPSGTRDPFGLRRAAIGVLRIARERRIDFDLPDLIRASVDAQPVADLAPRAAAVAAEVQEFVMERLRAQYLEDAAGGVGTELFDAVLASQPRSLADTEARVAAMVGFLKLPAAASLAAANRRIANILKKSTEAVPGAVDAALLVHAAERALHEAIESRRGGVESALARRDYGSALATLAGLAGAVDAFFDQVLVNDPDERLRANRLALLGGLRALFTRIADLSRLPG